MVKRDRKCNCNVSENKYGSFDGGALWFLVLDPVS